MPSPRALWSSTDAQRNRRCVTALAGENGSMARKISAKELEWLQKKCEEFVEYWKSHLGLADWSIHVELQREALLGCPAWMLNGWRSKKATIYIYADAFLKYDTLKAKLEYAIVHELLHCLLDPVLSIEFEEQEPYLEQAIQTIAEILTQLKAARPESDVSSLA